MSDTTLFDLFYKAMVDSLDIANKSILSGIKLPTVPFNGIEFHANGMPSYGSDIEITDYSRAISEFTNVRDLASFQALADYIASVSRLRKYFSFAGGYDATSRWWVAKLVLDATERYIYRFESDQPNLESITTIYREIEPALFNSTLPIDIIIPVPNVAFEFDELKIDENISLWRMDAPFQQARMEMNKHGSYGAGNWIAQASHALVLHNWTLPNEHFIKTVVTGASLNSEALDIIETLFASLRIGFNVKTAYVQVVHRPLGWVVGSDADMPGITYDALQGYRQDLDYEFAKNAHDVEVISTEASQYLKALFSGLYHAPQKNVSLAVKRLNQALIREQEEDSILDATIAMEALVAPENSAEITHRLKLRLAALAKLSGTHSQRVDEILQNVPKIYSYRSAVIHGNIEPHKKRQIMDMKTNAPIPAVELAIDYLKMALAVLAQHPQYLEHVKIDSELLLGINSSS